jgi:hypothetical protein
VRKRHNNHEKIDPNSFTDWNEEMMQEDFEVVAKQSFTESVSEEK